MLKEIMHQIILIGLIGIIAVISGCERQVKIVVTGPLHASGVVSPKVPPYYTPRQRLLQRRARIENRLGHLGIQIMQVGDEVRIVLPQDKMFAAVSPKLFENAYEILDLVAAYLRTFRLETAEVATYTENDCSLQRNYALSKARSQAIAEYLWEAKVGVRALQPRGYSHCEPISDNSAADLRARVNQRTEITFTEYFD